MAGLAILKHTYDLSDEALCDRWVENPYFQYFCGEEFFQHSLVFDALAPADARGQPVHFTAPVLQAGAQSVSQPSAPDSGPLLVMKQRMPRTEAGNRMTPPARV